MDKRLEDLADKYANKEWGNIKSPNVQRYEWRACRNDFLAGAIAGLKMAEEIASTYGYTVDYHSKYQPWSRMANIWLRAQNQEIFTQIRAIYSDYFSKG